MATTKFCLGRPFWFAVFRPCHARDCFIPGWVLWILHWQESPKKNKPKGILPLILLIIEHSTQASSCKYFELNPQLVQIVSTLQRSFSLCQCSQCLQGELFILSIHKSKPAANGPGLNVFVSIDRSCHESENKFYLNSVPFVTFSLQSSICFCI